MPNFVKFHDARAMEVYVNPDHVTAILVPDDPTEHVQTGLLLAGTLKILDLSEPPDEVFLKLQGLQPQKKPQS